MTNTTNNVIITAANVKSAGSDTSKRGLAVKIARANVDLPLQEQAALLFKADDQGRFSMKEALHFIKWVRANGYVVGISVESTIVSSKAQAEAQVPTITVAEPRGDFDYLGAGSTGYEAAPAKGKKSA